MQNVVARATRPPGICVPMVISLMLCFLRYKHRKTEHKMYIPVILTDFFLSLQVRASYNSNKSTNWMQQFLKFIT